MIILNIRLWSAKRFVCILGIISVILAIICVLTMVSMHDSVSDSATCDELGTYSLIVNSRDEHLRFLEQFGLCADKKSIQTAKVTIPDKFNSVYEEYNGLQKVIGLDLGHYKGCIAEKITYKITNRENTYAVLLVYKDRVIGGHLTNGEYGGKNMPLTG